MRRNTPKRAAAERAARPMLDQFRKDNPLCWICGSRQLLHVHDIASGGGRGLGRQHRENLCMFCCDCHEILYIHDGEQWHQKDKIAREYALKRIRDPRWYNRKLLNQLRSEHDEAITGDDVRRAHEYVKGILQW